MTGRSGLSLMRLIGFLLYFISLSRGGRIRPVPDLPRVNFSQPGDLNLGVVLSLHTRAGDALCSNRTRGLYVLQRLEAIAFAVEEINNRSDLLPNVKLGFIALDDCLSKAAARARGLHFIQSASNSSTVSGSGETIFQAVSVVAVIGSEGSVRSLEMAGLFSLFQVPQLSYLSSSALLDNRVRFSYFSRTVPSDTLQALAIADILMTFGWTYVSILYSEGSYGTEGLWTMRKTLEVYGYCLAVTQIVKRNYGPEQYEDVVTKLLAKPQARVVLLLVFGSHARKLFHAVDRLNLCGYFTWVCGDVVSMNHPTYQKLKHVVAGAISVSFVSSPVDRFEQRFKHMTLRTGTRNPWFKEFVSALFNCSLSSGSGPEVCDEDTEIMALANYRPEPTASLSFNAIYAMAYALDAIVKNCTLDDVRLCVKPQLLLDTLRSVRFAGEGVNISFDDEGNGQSSFQIYNLALINGSLVMIHVGAWDTLTRNFSFFNKHQIRWNPTLKLHNPTTSDEDDVPPTSMCSQPCAPGYQAVVAQPSCCFYCEECRENERTVISDTFPRCERCPTRSSFTWPDEETKTMCLPIPATYLHILRPEGVLLFTFNVLVFVITGTTTFFYIKNGNSPLIKASSRELSVMMLAGNVLTCIQVMIFVLQPTTTSCIIVYAGFHLSFTATYAPLLVRTNRIYRIFNIGRMTRKKPLFIDSKTQTFFATFIITVQILLTCITIAIDHPVAQSIMHRLNEKMVHRECSVPQVGFVVCISFNLILMTVCAFHAFKTRMLPTNFNETKFIMFCIYTTVLLWLAFLPTYFTAKHYMTKALCFAGALLFNVLSTQTFLFLPKLYAVYFLSEEELEKRRALRFMFSSSALSLEEQSTGISTVSRHRTGLNAEAKEENVRSNATAAADRNDLAPADMENLPLNSDCKEELTFCKESLKQVDGQALTSADGEAPTPPDRKDPVSISSDREGLASISTEDLASAIQEGFASVNRKELASVGSEEMASVEGEDLASVGEND